MQNKSLKFILGILCLGAGLFLIGQAVSVSTVWGFRIGGTTLPQGIVVVPLLIGIGMLFYDHTTNAWKIVTTLGVLFILLAVILSVRITMARVTLFEFVLMFGSTTAGLAMLLRYWFYDRN